MNSGGGIKIVPPLAVLFFCLFEFILQRESRHFREWATVLLSLRWMLVACLAVWYCALSFPIFNLTDLALIGFLLVGVDAYFKIDTGHPVTEALTLLAGVTVGKGSRFLLQERAKMKNEWKLSSESRGHTTRLRMFLIVLAGLLAFTSWWQFKKSSYDFYHGPRWTGIWDNPNTYGVLMGAGTILTVGLRVFGWRFEVHNPNLLAASPKTKPQRPKSVGDVWSFFARTIPFFAAGMMFVGLVMGYSRGAWFGTATGLVYLAMTYQKFKWRWVLPVALVAVAAVLALWGRTSNSAPWYVKRMDLSRPSAQHRVSAWHAGFQMMWDHPFGVGWEKAVEVYQKDYSPPEDGAMALTTNDYLMLGTQLGVPGLACFVTYVVLCFRKKRPERFQAASPPTDCGQEPSSSPVMRYPSLQTVCRAAALSMLVAFWFDGGLFVLATGSVFWVLLELGRET